MKNTIIYLSLCVLLITGCDMFTRDLGTGTSSNKPFRINENGDTVKIVYSDNGKICSEIPLKGGYKHGLAVNFYQDGKIKNEIMYVDGVKQGRATTYYENGALYRESTFVDGKLDGIQKRYYDDGKLMAEVPYKDGELQTGTKEYNKSGELKNVYPEILLELEDKTAFESKFILKASLSKKCANTKFYRKAKVEGDSYLVAGKTKNGVGEFSWELRKGASYMEKIVIVAEFTTALNNPIRIEKPYNLALQYR